MAAAVDWTSCVEIQHGDRVLEINLSQDPVGLRVEGIADLRCFREASFDKVVAVDAIESWGEAFDDLYELQRVLRPGGVLVLGFSSPVHVEPLLRQQGFEDVRRLHRVQGGPEIKWTGARAPADGGEQR